MARDGRRRRQTRRGACHRRVRSAVRFVGSRAGTRRGPAVRGEAQMTTAIYKPVTRQEQYANWLRGKRVVVVGPAGYLQGQHQGDFIDSHDVVVKLNWG